MRKLYNRREMDPDNHPQSLQNKVQFDIRFFMCRRRNENLYTMTKKNNFQTENRPGHRNSLHHKDRR